MHQCFACCGGARGMPCRRIGEAINPGPGEAHSRKAQCTEMRFVNLTSYWNNFQTSLVDAPAFVGICEHAIDQRAVNAARAVAWKQGYKLVVGPSDPECTVPKGGVGALVLRGMEVLQPKPMTREFDQVVKLGRAIRLVWVPSPGLHVAVYVVYGHPGADDDSWALQRSRAIFQAINLEASAARDDVRVIMGDFNCTLSNVPEILGLIRTGGLVDVGGVREFAGDDVCACTCYAHNSRVGSR
eukprot:11612507-Alexandrium_andersonii.AAC.2